MRILPLLLVIALARVASAGEPAPHSLVVHVAPQSLRAGQPVELAAMIDAPYAEALSVAWRSLGEAGWHEVLFERSSAGRWFATLPPPHAPGLEYFIHGKDVAGAEIAHFASAAHPHVVRVEPDEVDLLEAIDVMAHDFSNRYGYDDRYLRAEATFTHLVLRSLYHIAFGFGAIQGETPDYEDMPTTSSATVTHEARYGFGELRLRLHRSVFADARIALGVSHEGFMAGARGALTFGKPWRSNLSIGAEAFGDIGAQGWVRLQWDTAPPLLMGASIVRTNFPGVLVDPNGLYVAYDIAYRVGRLSLKGQISYGARDGAAHLGGGLGTAVDF